MQDVWVPDEINPSEQEKVVKSMADADSLLPFSVIYFQCWLKSMPDAGRGDAARHWAFAINALRVLWHCQAAAAEHQSQMHLDCPEEKAKSSGGPE